MKNFIVLILAFACISTSAFAQLKVVAPGDVGIGIDAPAEKLDVDGALKIGTTTNSNAGTIRYTGSDFEGRVGTSWMSLTGGSSGGSGGAMWSENGGNAYFNDGRVGVGTDDPQQLIHISNSSGAAAFLCERADRNNFFKAVTGASGSAFTYADFAFVAFSPQRNTGDVFTYETSSLYAFGDMHPNYPGRFGIGTAQPTHKLHVAGDIKYTGALVPSDEKLKSGVKNFDKGLKEVLELEPVYFAYNGKGGTAKGDRHVGILAQDLKEQAPELVSEYRYIDNVNNKISLEEEDTQRTSQKGNTYLEIKDNELKYLLLNAIKDQQEIIQRQEKIIGKLVSRVDSLEKSLPEKQDLPTNKN